MSWWPEDLVMAPIPGYSPQLGWMLTLVGGYFMDLDKRHPDTPPSVIGAMAMGSQNSSYVLGGGGKFYLMDDRLRISAGAGYADINYRYYGVGHQDGDQGRSTEIRQEMPLAYADATWAWIPNLFAGLGLQLSRATTSIRLPGSLPPGLPDPEVDLDLVSLHLPVQYDTRDDQLFPRTGWSIQARARFFSESLGSDFEAQTVSLQINRYLPFRGSDVLALRAYLKGVGGDAPFFVLSSFGGNTDLRGYVSGRYRDNWMYAVQGEYRWRPVPRWVFTGFVGVGEVAPDPGGFLDSFLPAAGIGARFMLSEKHNFSISADLAAGKDGYQFYFGVGEAF